MMVSRKIKLANRFRGIARYSLLIISVMTLILAVIFGSEDFGEGWSAIVENSPNALPWLVLLGLVLLAWRRELIGGLSIAILGFVTLILTSAFMVFFVSTFILLLLISILGLFFVASWRLRREVNRSRS